MMIHNSYTHSPGAQALLATILNEIVGSHSSQVTVEELGLSIATHVGSKRSRNEDRVAVARIPALNRETYTVALVCDGVGGSESGDEAAALAVASIIADLAQQQGRSTLKELVIGLVKRADEIVRKELRGRGATTLVMLLATADGNFLCANVGDSRAYSWDPNSKKFDQVTIDDTIENELKDLPGNGTALIRARGLQGRLSQAIGESGRSADELRIQTYTKEHFPMGAVLGSDGLWRIARDFEALVANTDTPPDAVRRAITHANLIGGVDNSSMIAISDLEHFCHLEKISNGRGQIEIELWLSSIKVKIISSQWNNEAKPSSSRATTAKSKPKSKRKENQEPENVLQLEIDAVDSKRSRPKIEVMVNEEPKK